MSIGKVLCKYLKTHKFNTACIILLIAVCIGLALLPAQILRIIVDDILKNTQTMRLLMAACVYMGTYIILGVVTFIKNVVLLSTSQCFTRDLRCSMMEHIHKMSYKELINSNSGALEAYFNNDVNAINELFTSGVVNMITDLFKMVGITISLFLYSQLFGFIVLGLIPILFIFTMFIRKKMLKAHFKTKDLEGNVNKVLLENVENIEQIKVNKAENYAQNKYNRILVSHYKANQSTNFYDAIFSPIMQILRNLVICSILLASGFNADIFGMSIGMIVSAITLLTDLFTPIENLGMEIQTIQKSLAAVKRINLFFKKETKQEGKIKELQNHSISFENVSFAYNEEKILENFNLQIPYGTRIALQGPSGAGKSTIMKLAMGLLKPAAGRCKIGDSDVHLIHDEKRRHLFSIVYQDPFFSGGSIYEEITLKNNNISKEEVFSALKVIGMEYIKDIDIPLNENLYSSGELALFNIARLIVQDSKIIFLDEMNAKIDPLTSKRIISLIDRFSEGKTIISINHYGNLLKNTIVIPIQMKKKMA